MQKIEESDKVISIDEYKVISKIDSPKHSLKKNNIYTIKRCILNNYKEYIIEIGNSSFSLDTFPKMNNRLTIDDFTPLSEHRDNIINELLKY